MDNSIPVVDIHSNHITLATLRDQLRANPTRLEEKKVKKDDGFDCQEENTPLISAADFGNVSVVEFLLSVGANVDAINKV